jgi:micrococcal nuclease
MQIEYPRDRKKKRAVFQMKKSIIFLMAFALLMTSAVFAESFSARVISVVDGDNIIVAKDTKLYRVKFMAIECPEIQQDYGIQARQFVTDLLLGKDVKVDSRAIDFDKRLLSTVLIDDKDVGLEITRAGYAWYDDRSHHNPQIAAAEKDARAKHTGLWSMANPVSPWQFRQKMLGVRAIMSPSPCVIGSGGGYGFSRNDNGYGFVEASWPPAGAVQTQVHGVEFGTGPGIGPLRNDSGPTSSPPSSFGPNGSPTFRQ